MTRWPRAGSRVYATQRQEDGTEYQTVCVVSFVEHHNLRVQWPDGTYSWIAREHAALISEDCGQTGMDL